MTPLEVVTQATFSPIPTAIIAVTLAGYLWSVRRLARTGRPWPRARTVSFCVAELLLAAGLVSGIDAHQKLFAVHAVQQVLISMLAPIFLGLSGLITLTLEAGGRRVQAEILRVLHSPVARRLSHPAFTWSFYGASIFVLYFTNLYAHTLHNQAVRDLVDVELIVAGCLFWWPAIAIDPLPYRLSPAPRIFYVLLAMPLHTILGMALESQSTPIARGISLSDLHTGGGILWVAGEATALLGSLALFVQWLRADERAAKRTDRIGEAAAATQLAHWRATRDAAAQAINS